MRPPPSQAHLKRTSPDTAAPSAGLGNLFEWIFQLFQALPLGLAVEAHGSPLLLLATHVCYHAAW
jgi:hypothetical protein